MVESFVYQPTFWPLKRDCRTCQTAYVEILLQPSITPEQYMMSSMFPSQLVLLRHTKPPQCAHCLWIVSVKLITVYIFRFSGSRWAFVITCMQIQEVPSVWSFPCYLCVCCESHVRYYWPHSTKTKLFSEPSQIMAWCLFKVTKRLFIHIMPTRCSTFHLTGNCKENLTFFGKINTTEMSQRCLAHV